MSTNGQYIIGGQLEKYEGDDIELHIPEGVSRICFKALMNNTKIEKVFLPSTLVSISECAFVGCINLKEVVISEGTESIELTSFGGCKRLDHVFIPKSVREIKFGSPYSLVPKKSIITGNDCFLMDPVEYDFEVLFEISEQNTKYRNANGCIVDTEDNALIFSNTSSYLPDYIKIIKSNSIIRSKADTISLPKNILRIESNAICGDSIKNIILQGNIEYIDDNAFLNCINLRSIQAVNTPLNRFNKAYYKLLLSGLLNAIKANINVPDFVISSYSEFVKKEYPILLDEKIISEMELEKIFDIKITKESFIPKTLADFKKIWSWQTCDNGSIRITSYKGDDIVVTVPSKIGKYEVSEIGPAAFSPMFESNAAKRIARQKIEKIIVSEGITTISSNAFSACSCLKTLILPKSLKVFNGGIDGTQIESIEIPDGTEDISHAFKQCDTLRTVKLPCGVKNIDFAFIDCSMLENVELPGSIVSCDRAFNASGIKKIVINEGVETIGRAMFEDCASLEEVSLPSTLKHVDPYAFSGCNSIKTINVALNDACYYEDGCLFLADNIATQFELPNRFLMAKETKAENTLQGIETINDMVFTDLEIERFEIPSGVHVIDKHAFGGCKKLHHVVIPDTVTHILDYAFDGCESLEEVEIPESVTQIGNRAFASCSNLKTVYIKSNIESMGYSCFDECTSLETVVLPDTLKTIPSKMFRKCCSLTYVKLPLFLREIEESAFCECVNLTHIELPEGLEKISKRAFENMDSLKKITIPISVKKIEKDAFTCTNPERINCRVTGEPDSWSREWWHGSKDIIHWAYMGD